MAAHPGPALDMVFEIGTPERAEAVIRAKLDRGERLMGFGHRVYRVRDPRADVLAERRSASMRATAIGRSTSSPATVEATALRLLRERKPDRRLDTNVEFYTALLLHGLGLPTELFTPTFAVGRVAGWSAHCLEQLRDGTADPAAVGLHRRCRSSLPSRQPGRDVIQVGLI